MGSGMGEVTFVSILPRRMDCPTPDEILWFEGIGLSKVKINDLFQVTINERLVLEFLDNFNDKEKQSEVQGRRISISSQLFQSTLGVAVESNGQDGQGYLPPDRPPTWPDEWPDRFLNKEAARDPTYGWVVSKLKPEYKRKYTFFSRLILMKCKCTHLSNGAALVLVKGERSASKVNWAGFWLREFLFETKRISKARKAGKTVKTIIGQIICKILSELGCFIHTQNLNRVMINSVHLESAPGLQKEFASTRRKRERDDGGEHGELEARLATCDDVMSNGELGEDERRVNNPNVEPLRSSDDEQGLVPSPTIPHEVEARFKYIRMPKPIIGLDLAIEKVQKMLEEDTRVGIVGMPGIGKTTLAMAVFNKLGPTFEYSCFVHSMKDIRGNVEDVKKKVWNHLHYYGKKVEWYMEDCWFALRGKRLFLVLDDIFSGRDLDVLSEIVDDIGARQSRFIVTSHDGDLVNNMDEIYRVPFLDDTNAKQLFMNYAFPNQAVPPTLESSVNGIVAKCSGLPLTLKHVGQYLHRKENIQVWLQALEDLDEAKPVSKRDEKFWEELRHIYNGLGEKVQEVFLDATTFFGQIHWTFTWTMPPFTRGMCARWTLRDAKAAWRGIHGDAEKLWQTLLDISFVHDVNEDEQIKVHEHLLCLGRKIASESTKCRISKYTEALKLLQSTDELDNQQMYSLRLESDESQKWDTRLDISRRGFRRLQTIRYLDLELPVSIQFEGCQEKETFPTGQLVLLGCHHQQFDRLPLDPTLFARLVVLKISCLTGVMQHLPRFFGQFEALKILEISDPVCLENLPDEIGRLSQLEFLKLACQRLSKLPDSFGELSNLKHLHFISPMLKTLPDSFGHLLALEHLEFQSCELLDSLPASFGDLCSLKHLEFLLCKLDSMPESFGHLPALKHLKFLYCKFNNLPESFGHLPALEHLVFLECILDSLPESFGHLPALVHLEFGFCEFHSLPLSFGYLPKLKHLKFDDCPNLAGLPMSFKLLFSLEVLQFKGCRKLSDLPEFVGQSKLQELVIEDCPLERIPNSLAELKNLHRLVIKCVTLTSIPDSIKALPSLQTLELGFLPFLKEFPPWLGKITPVSFVTRIFHVRGGCFALAQEQNMATCNDWLSELIRKDWMDKLKSSDYGGALIAFGGQL